MAASGLGSSKEVGHSVFNFHGDSTLAYKGVQIESFKKTWQRDIPAALKILFSGFKTEVIAATASALPANDPLRNFLTKMMVKMLYNSMLHPPLSYKGQKFQHRAADGGCNNYLLPELGKAGLPYAKTVAGVRAAQGAKPDPGDLFDLLLAREDEDEIKETDLGISSMLLYHADLIIHDIFRTNSRDKNISDTSSYLDLSPLYGKDREHQEAVRTMENGLMKPDSFAEDRLLGQPPGVCIYLIMYNRFHNYVAQQLREINENGKFTRADAMPRSADWHPTKQVLSRTFDELLLPRKARAPAKIKNDKGEVVENKKVRGSKWPNEAWLWPSGRRRRGWMPDETSYGKMLEDVWKEQNPGKAKPSDWDPYDNKPSDRMVEKKQLNKLLGKAWSDIFEKPKKATWTPSDEDKGQLLDAAWEVHADIKLDEDVFQTARIITCGLYINISVHDYLRCLMRKHVENTNWTLDPRLEMSTLIDSDKQGVTRGIGNQVTVEFNVLYRFHSPLSRRDAAWTKRFMQGYLKSVKKTHKEGYMTEEQFNNGDLPLSLMREVLQALNERGGSADEKFEATSTPSMLSVDVPTGPGVWNVKQTWLTRGEDGRFDSHDLLSEMVRVMEDPICQFGAKNVPKFFRSIEILGILQSRKWEIATLNEFREFFGLSRHTTFEDINSDKDISDALATVYEHPDMVELYPGLFCEGQGRCLDPGTSGPGGSGTALWRGVFSDAVTLVRSDRFYTLDWNVDTLTSWGMNEVTPDREVFKGGVMARLFQRAFPGFFAPNSIHVWQPFYTPAMNLILAHDQQLLHDMEPGQVLRRAKASKASKASAPTAGGADALKQLLGVSVNEFETIMNPNTYTNILGTDYLQYVESSAADGNSTNGSTTKPITKSKTTRKMPFALSTVDANDVNRTKDDLKKAHDALPWHKRVFHSRKGDQQRLYTKLRYKQLRDVVKMTVPQNPKPPTRVSNFKTIEWMLSESETHLFKNPGYADRFAIPHGPLRNILSNGNLLRDGIAVFNEELNILSKQNTDLIFDYFVMMAENIRSREELAFKKYSRPGEETPRQVYQIDVVRDYAIPVITRFVADFLGFGHEIKTSTQTKRKYDENEIYDHFNNCQDYLTFDSDEARAYRCGRKFQSSIKTLQVLAEQGVRDAKWDVFDSVAARTYHKTAGDEDTVIQVRQFGSHVAQKLMDTLRKPSPDLNLQEDEQGSKVEQAAAVMLAVALDIVHKSVAMFVVVMECLLCTREPGEDGVQNRPYWKKIMDLRKVNKTSSTNTISKYILEAQRIHFDIPLIRQYVGSSGIPLDLNEDTPSYQPGHGEQFMLEVRKASTADRTDTTINTERDNYLIYGNCKDGVELRSAKHLTIVALTGLISHLASLDQLREAPDTMGCVKTVKTPVTGHEALDAHRKRYMTPKWDEVVPIPTTWNLRYDGLPDGQTAGVYKGGDNSRQGHGMEQLAGADEGLSANGGSAVAVKNTL